MRKDFRLCVFCLDLLDISLVDVGGLWDHCRFVNGVYLAILLDVIEKLFFIANLVGVLAMIDKRKRF